ncbi:MAG: leucine-rich repeat domain-containing protein [Promethearchaeota archaeon]
MQEFKINDYITLNLEGGATYIHVKGELFRQCKFLLLEIPCDDVEQYDDIDSIDEAAKILDRSMEEGSENQVTIPPETEFWGHCSNLQAWAEYGYDTRILHSNLAFPLLKRLTEAGDLGALKVFKEEIVKRFVSGDKKVLKYLVKEKYHEYLGKEEFDVLLTLLKKDERLLKCILNAMRIPENLVIDPDYYPGAKLDNFFLKAEEKSPIFLEKLLNRLFDTSETPGQIISIFYNCPKDALTSVMRGRKIKAYEKILKAFRPLEMNGVGKIYSDLRTLISEIGKQNSQIVKKIIIKTLKGENYHDFFNIVSFTWFDLLDEVELRMLIKDTKIDLIKKLATFIKIKYFKEKEEYDGFKLVHLVDFEYIVKIIYRINCINPNYLNNFLKKIEMLKKDFFESLVGTMRIHSENKKYKDYIYDILKILDEENKYDVVSYHGEKFLVGPDRRKRFSLYIYDRRDIEKMCEIIGIDKLEKLKYLHLSSNSIKEIKCLENLTELEDLCLADNKIEEISGLENLTNLTKLNLNENKIKEIKNLDKLTNLKELELTNNQINEIDGLNNLVKIQSLALSNNQIKKVNGLSNLEQLKELYLSENQISKFRGTVELRNLQILDLRNNPLVEIVGIENLKSLHEFGVDIKSLPKDFKQKLEESLRANFNNMQETRKGYATSEPKSSF